MADPTPETEFVQGRHGAARYPLEGWRELFLRHPRAGGYDSRQRSGG